MGIKYADVRDLDLDPTDHKREYLKPEMAQAGSDCKKSVGNPLIKITLQRPETWDPKNGGCGLIFKGKMTRQEKAENDVCIKVVSYLESINPWLGEGICLVKFFFLHQRDLFCCFLKANVADEEINDQKVITLVQEIETHRAISAGRDEKTNGNPNETRGLGRSGLMRFFLACKVDKHDVLVMKWFDGK